LNFEYRTRNDESRRNLLRTLKYAFLLLLAHRLTAQPAFLTDSLDRYVTRGMADWQIPGLAVAVVKDGKVVCSKGYGVREAGKPDRVDENTLFMIGSNTKALPLRRWPCWKTKKSYPSTTRCASGCPPLPCTTPWLPAKRTSATCSATAWA
jgi:hypothetical protein